VPERSIQQMVDFAPRPCLGDWRGGRHR